MREKWPAFKHQGHLEMNNSNSLDTVGNIPSTENYNISFFGLAQEGNERTLSRSQQDGDEEQREKAV